MLEFKKEINGLHQLGGEKPMTLEFPENKFISNFQYIGLVNTKDEYFNWLPFDLHLICPIFLNIEEVYLDYSNPSKPLLISPEETEKVDTEYLDLKLDSYIEFESMKVSVENVKEIDDME